MRTFPLSFTCLTAGTTKVLSGVCVLEWHASAPKHAFIYRVMRACHRSCRFALSVFRPRRESRASAMPASLPRDSPEGRGGKKWCRVDNTHPARASCRRSSVLSMVAALPCSVVLFITVPKNKTYLSYLNTCTYTLRLEARGQNRNRS